ncbi:MAG TPA: histidine kinase N-terminal 7TM domain-containing protein [Bacteroidales bacterium]|nr:histidine kinase N-terminal 7TM domain-containing protein [Bacteroidales bacterium]
MHPLSLILLLTSFINLLIAFYTIRYYKSPGALAYLSILLCIALYAFGYVMELNSDNLEDIYFWLKVEYVGIALFPSVLVIFTLHYTGYNQYLKKWMIVVMIAISCTTIVLQNSNFGHLFYTKLAINTAQSSSFANFTKGPWYWVHQVYSNLTLLFSFLLYVWMAIKQVGINRVRAFLMIVSLTIPWGFYIYYLSSYYKSNMDIIPFSFSIVGIMGALGMFRFKLLDFEPLALEVIFESMSDGVIIVDKKLRITNFNNHAKQIFNNLNEKSIGKSIEKILEQCEDTKRIAFRHEEYSTDIENDCFGGRRYFLIKTTPVFENKDRLAGWAIILSDITQRKLNEVALKENAKKLKELNATKDKFMGIIAHDLRNPFHVLINLSEMVQQDIADNNYEDAGKCAEMLYETAKNTHTLLQNLLEWSNFQRQGVRFNPEWIDVAEALKDDLNTIELLASQKKITIKKTISPGLKAYADSQMLKTIVRNLMTNAIKYSYTHTEVFLQIIEETGNIKISIQDCGVGLSQEDLSRLFKFETSFSKSGTASERGTGLGLVLCAEFVALHKGQIWAESIPEKGSTFNVLLPLNNN